MASLYLFLEACSMLPDWKFSFIPISSVWNGNSVPDIVLQIHSTWVLLDGRLEKISFVRNDYVDMYVILNNFLVAGCGLYARYWQRHSTWEKTHTYPNQGTYKPAPFYRWLGSHQPSSLCCDHCTRPMDNKVCNANGQQNLSLVLDGLDMTASHPPGHDPNKMNDKTTKSHDSRQKLQPFEGMHCWSTNPPPITNPGCTRSTAILQLSVSHNTHPSPPSQVWGPCGGPWKRSETIETRLKQKINALNKKL